MQIGRAWLQLGVLDADAARARPGGQTTNNTTFSQSESSSTACQYNNLLAGSRNYRLQVLGTVVHDPPLAFCQRVASDHFVAIEPETSVGGPP